MRSHLARYFRLGRAVAARGVQVQNYSDRLAGYCNSCRIHDHSSSGYCSARYLARYDPLLDISRLIFLQIFWISLPKMVICHRSKGWLYSQKTLWQWPWRKKCCSAACWCRGSTNCGRQSMAGWACCAPRSCSVRCTGLDAVALKSDWFTCCSRWLPVWFTRSPPNCHVVFSALRCFTHSLTLRGPLC